MAGGIRTYPDGDGVARIIRKLGEIDPDGTWEAVYVEAIATYLGVSQRVVKGQIASRRRIQRQRKNAVHGVELEFNE